MKVLVKATGKIEDVSEGYARNFLIPKGMAIQATDDVVANHEAGQKAQLESQQTKIQTIQALLQTDALRKVEFTVPANAEGKLFGSITQQQVTEYIVKASQGAITDHDIKVQFEAVKVVGDYKAKVSIVHTDIVIPIQVHIQTA